MGTAKHNYSTIGLLIAVCFSLPARSFAMGDCAKLADIHVDDLDKVLKNMGVQNTENPCEEQTKFDDGANCKKSFDALPELEKERKKIVTDRCTVNSQIHEMPADGTADGSQSTRAALVKKLADYDMDEAKNLKSFMAAIENVKNYQIKLAKGALDMQKDAEQKASSDASGHTAMDIDKLKRLDGNIQTNQQASNYFKDNASSVESAISGLEKGATSLGEIQTKLTKEPMQIAAASNTWSKQMQGRLDMLYGRNPTLAAQAATGNTNAGNTSTLNNNSTPAASTGLGSATQAAQAAAPAASALSAGSGAGASSPSSASPSYGSNAAPTSYGTAGSALASNSAGPSSLAGSSTAAPESNSIKNLNTAVASADPTGGAGSASASGASTSKGSALRSAIRDRLAGGSAGAPGTTTAAAGGSGGTGASASSGAIPDALLPAHAAVASEDPLLAASGSAGGDLGNTSFSMAGADTDAAVQGMLKEFSGSNDSGRGPASVQKAPEILAQDSASLFLRARETHQRSLKKGLVLNGLRAKL